MGIGSLYDVLDDEVRLALLFLCLDVVRLFRHDSYNSSYPAPMLYIVLVPSLLVGTLQSRVLVNPIEHLLMPHE